MTKKQIIFAIHSMARANLKKSVWLVTNTTAASKYIPRRTRISINWDFLTFKRLYKVEPNRFKAIETCIILLENQVAADFFG